MNALLEVSFAEVARIHLLWPVAMVVLALAWLERRGQADMAKVLSSAMQARLVAGPSRRRRRWRLACLATAMVAAVFALMRPQAAAQPTTEAIAAHSADVMIVLDVSKSMLAEDVTPNRLARAKADIARLATRLAGARLGLVVFAGRAAVACPLTIDDAFFRFALRDVDTNSVARGGTRIGEALRVATKAFPPGLGAKLVVLITDGEDQDSYPLEAAKEAAAAGVRVIAVGLGSDEGSQIVITDPATGAKTTMLHDGAPVISRIDGAMLQRLADATGGAFVPAKTAAIDLESIVSEHVVPMLRDEVVKHTRTAHRPLHGWLVLLALLALMGAVAAGRRPTWTLAASGRGAASLLLVLLLGCATDDAARVEYNDGVAALRAGKLDEAEAAFTAARSESGADAELRFHAAFNLAAVAVARAEAAAAMTPPKLEEAIKQLKAAQGWLYSAKSLRPTHAATEENLRAVKTRSVAFVEQLNAGKHGLEARLDAAIAAQRGLRDEARQLQAQVLMAGSLADPMQLAPAGAALALTQQALLAEAGVVSDMAAAEIEALTQASAGAAAGAGTGGGTAAASEQAARLAQLQALDQYIALARSAMVDTRRLAQQVRTELAAARSADALEHLKRAREQLMDPIAVMQAIASEQVEALTLTAQKPTNEAPAWATDDLLRAQQRQLASRLRQVQAPLAAAVAAPAPTPAAGEAAAPDEAQAKLLAKVAQALPFVAAALAHMDDADTQLAAKAWAAAAAAQEQALASLAQAMEQFADAKQMIDMAWQSQQVVGQALLAPKVSSELARHVREAVGRNGARLAMLQALLGELKVSELAAAAAPAAQAAGGGGAAPPNADEARAAIESRFAKAEALRVEAAAATAALKAAMARGDQAAQATQAKRALEALTELRTLFYTLLEHLKQLAADQAQTRDDTTAAGDALDDRAARLAAPLAAQETHLGMADAIATALAEAADAAAKAAPSGNTAGAGPTAAPAAGPSGDQLRGAAQEVVAARGRMQTAVTTLQAAIGQAGVASVDVTPTLAEQAEALVHLRKAIEILEPPPPDEPQAQNQDQQAPPPPPQDGQDKPKDEAGGGAAGAEPGAKPASQPPTGNALQRAQEREAERRRNQPRARPQPVEKDW